MAARQYFLIQSQGHPQLVLTIKDFNIHSGAKVITETEKPGIKDNQLFYADGKTGTIRSRLNDFAIDIEGDGAIVINPYNDTLGQQWKIEENKIMNKAENLFIEESDPERPVMAKAYSSSSSQRWLLVHRSILDSKLVLGVDGGEVNKGDAIVTQTENKPNKDSQLFYEDENKTFRTKIGAFALDLSDTNTLIVYNPVPDRINQQWEFNENVVRNKKNNVTVLGISGGKNTPGALILAGDDQGRPDQQWERVDAPVPQKEPDKTENHEFEFK